MRFLSRAASGLALMLVAVSAVSAAEPVRTPRGYIPAEADLVLEASSPKALVETLYQLEAAKKIQELPAIKELLDSTQYRRFYKLIAYFEKELGAQWPELLDQLAGNGLALGIKFAPDPAPALLVVQAKDEAQVQKFKKLLLDLIDQELARQESKEKPVKDTYQNVETLAIGKDFHLALAGKTLLLANKAEVLKRSLDLHAGKGEGKSLADVPAVGEAKQLLPKDALATLWINMEPVQKSEQFKEIYKSPREPVLTIAFGAYADLVTRTPYVAAGLCKEKDGYLLTIRMPRGREGMGHDLSLHLAKDGEAGTRPLLEPKEVLYSESSYLDFATIWNDREKLFGKDAARAFDEADKNSAKLISGLQLSKQLQQAAPYYRFVAVNQAKGPYAKQPKQLIPAFAVVLELRDPEAFGKTMETVLRGAGLLATQQTKLKIVEEKHHDIDIVGYRFAENGTLPQDVNDLRFNFEPCFCRVGNQYVVCSTLALCRELIDIVTEEQKTGHKGSPAKVHYKVYGPGLAAVAQNFADQFNTQAILDQALTPEQAKAQTQVLLELLKQAGVLEIEAVFTAKEFHYDIRIKSGK